MLIPRSGVQQHLTVLKENRAYQITLYRLLLFLLRSVCQGRGLLGLHGANVSLQVRIFAHIEALVRSPNDREELLALLLLIVSQTGHPNEEPLPHIVSSFFCSLCVDTDNFRMAKHVSGYLSHIRWILRATLLLQRMADP